MLCKCEPGHWTMEIIANRFTCLGPKLKQQVGVVTYQLSGYVEYSYQNRYYVTSGKM